MNGCYERWRSMLRRCYDPQRRDFRYYGRRGIRVCREWHRFSGFLSWFKVQAERLPSSPEGGDRAASRYS